MTTTPDDVLASAVEIARSAVLELAPAAHVGDHVDTVADDAHLVTHTFVCLDRGYRGWRWAATLARTPGSTDVSVAEVVLLPGPEALLAPAWVPWEERVRPGDLGPGDLHPTPLDDPRLEPGFSGADALEAADENIGPAPLRPEQWQLGLGRETVLSPYGRGVAADRWYDGEFGPDAPMAKAAPGHCDSCGFLLPIGGQLGQVFGACANPFGADGRIVALGYGCGAHSSVRPLDGTGVPVTGIAVDDDQVEVVDLATVPLPPARPVVDDEADELEPIAVEVAVEEAVTVDAADLEEGVLGSDDPAFVDAGPDQVDEAAYLDPAPRDVEAVEDAGLLEPALEGVDTDVDDLDGSDLVADDLDDDEDDADDDEDDSDDDADDSDDDADDEDDDDDADEDDDDEDDDDADEDDDDEDDDDDADEDEDDEPSELDDVADIEPDEVLG